MAESRRSVFTVLASLGPGGAIAVLVEKFLSRVFPESYDLGEEHEFRPPEESEIRKLRQDYVNELFDLKAQFEEVVANPASSSEQILEEYKNLNEIADTYIDSIKVLEKQKYNKMKIFYQKEENQAKYDHAHMRLEELDIEIRDNMYKMAIHILKGSDLHVLHQVA